MKFREYLEEIYSEDMIDCVSVESAMMDMAHQLRGVLEESGLSIRGAAAKMGQRSTSQVQRLVDVEEGANPTLRTLVRFARACGYDLFFEMRPSKGLRPVGKKEWEEAGD